MKKLSLLLCTILIITMILPNTTLNANAISSFDDLVKKISLSNTDGSPVTGSVSLADDLMLRYNLIQLEDSMALPGETFTLSIPSYIRCTDTNLDRTIHIGEDDTL